MLGEALNYITSSLDKPGRAVRGILGGNLREGLAAIPFSDSLGITDPSQRVSGRSLTDRWGITGAGDQGWDSWVLGVGAELATDPLQYLGGAAGAKLARALIGGAHAAEAGSAAEHIAPHIAPLPIDTEAMALNSAANNGSRARRFSLDPAKADYYARSRAQRFADRLGGQTHSLGLKYDNLDEPRWLGSLKRNDPEWINNKTWYHGTGYPGLKAEDIDPLKADPEALFGRGFYTTADEGMARTYTEKGVGGAGRSMFDLLSSPDFVDDLVGRVRSGEFDTLLSSHPSYKGFTKPSAKAGAVQALVNMAAGRGHIPSKEEGALAREVGGMFGIRAPRPVIYQMQPSFGKIMDLDTPEKLIYDQLASDAQPLRRLREAGYDALTHTGGVRAGGGQSLHQVLIGLDPNDVLGLGRKTPYQKFEELTHGLIDGSGSNIGTDVPGSYIPENGVAHSSGGLSARLRPLREKIPAVKGLGTMLERVIGGNRGTRQELLNEARQFIRPMINKGSAGVAFQPWKAEEFANDLGFHYTPGSALILEPHATREEILHAMTQRAAHEGNIGSLPMLARPAARMYRVANATGSRSLEGLGIILDELSAQTMAQRGLKNRAAALGQFLYGPRTRSFYGPNFRQYGLVPDITYQAGPYLPAAIAAGAGAGYALTRE